MTKARTAWYVAELHPKYRNHLNDLKKRESNEEIRGYLSALCDAEVISPVQYRALLIYFTL